MSGLSKNNHSNVASFGLNPRFTSIGALDPETISIDERSLSERLSFSAQFAQLIIYFDQQNQPDGDWQRLLLKDPVILLATISHMDYRQTHRLFLLLRHQLVNAEDAPLFVSPAPGETVEPKIKVADSFVQSFNQLLALLQQLFVTINDWVVHMDNDDKQYNIKQFVNQQVKGQLSLLLAQFLTVHKLAFANYQEINIPDIALFDQFYSTWFDGQFNQQPEHLAQDCDLVELIGKIYYQVFGFYVQVIKAAGSSFDSFCEGVNHYPDTALLVAFVKLLRHQQEQQNTLTKKHLDFYYQQVLNLNPATALPDSTYVMVKLKPTQTVLTLPQGTAFNAGADSQGVAQQFVSTQQQILNQAKILAVQTLRYQQPQHRRALLYSQIKDATKLQTDPQGQLVSWPLLGDDDSGSVVQQGFCIASPLLALNGGDRTITMVFEFATDNCVDGAQLLDCECYLSTQTAWLKVAIVGVNLLGNKLHLVLNVDKTQPAIENFKVDTGKTNPDGFNAQWPLFKLLLSSLIPLTVKYVIKTLSIKCEVTECPQVSLFANDAMTTPGKEFQLFGPIADTHNRFYIGSDEVFAKPVSALSVTFEWSKLPAQMVNYYQTYNQYITNKDKTFGQDSDAATTPINPQELLTTPYNNQAFHTGFYWFDGMDWQNIAVNISNDEKFSDSAPAASDKDVNATPNYQVYLFIEQTPSEPLADDYKNPGVYSKDDKEQIILTPTFSEGTLATISQFVFTSEAIDTIKPDVNLLSDGIDFNSDNKSGFVLMELTAPSYGFGQDIYPQVITAVTQQNGLQMILLGSRTLKGSALKIGDYQPIALPNLPYAPTVSRFTLNYVAAKDYDLTTSNDYPLQFYHRDSLSTYQVYDAQNSVAVIKSSSQSPSVELSSQPTGVPFFAGINELASTYIVIGGLQPPCNLSLYCHLDHLVSLYQGQSSAKVDCHYLSLSGWKKLHILDDQTNGLTCSGAIEVFIDGDIALNTAENHGLMPLPPEVEGDDGAWLAISSNGTGDQFAFVDFIDTQAVKVERAMSIAQRKDTDVELYLAPDSISALVVADNGVDSIIQPFASFGGQLAQTEHQFYRTTSARIANKGRISSNHDLCQQIFDYLPALYYCQHIPSYTPVGGHRTEPATPNTGEVKLALIQGYGQTTQVSALRPSVPPCQLTEVTEALNHHVSPFVSLKVFNFTHCELQVQASLVFVANVSVNQLLQQITEQLQWFLSPWVVAAQKQRDITTPLTRADLLAFLTSYSQVSAVQSMTLYINGSADSRNVLDVGIDNVIISSSAHQLSAVASATMHEEAL